METDFLLVDGHSMIFAWPELRALHQQDQEAGRDRLIRELTDYQDGSGIKVVLVFDGAGRRAEEATVPGGIQIFYAATGMTADALIERLVAQYAQRARLLVATDDRQEQQTVISLGGDFITASELWRRLEEGRRLLEQQVKATQRRSTTKRR